MGTLAVGVLIAGWIAFTIRTMRKDKKAGKSVQCGGDCRHCGGHCH